MSSNGIKVAVATLRKAKWRSFLTMFGIIVGVVSVITTVSLGEGVKQQVLGQVNSLGKDLVTIRPGNIVTRDKNGIITDVNLSASYGFGSGTLSEQDIELVQRTALVGEASPIGLLSATAKTDSAQYDSGQILGTSEKFPALIGQKLEYGMYFSEGEQNRHVAVIGKRVAEQLFQENAPVGKSLSIRGQDFVVRGVFEEFGASRLGNGIDLNRMIYVPYAVAKSVGSGSIQIPQVLVRPKVPDQVQPMVANLTKQLLDAHGGDNDVTVLRQDENLQVTSSLLDVLASFVLAIALLSMLVGGIGIMNIMLVSVSERTREIGIRKAVGATNRQIRSQFMTEAAVMSVVGGLFGIGLSYLVNFCLRIGTNLKPVISLEVIILAVLVSGTVGVLFGLVPAAKAARKDPIDALRYD